MSVLQMHSLPSRPTPVAKFVCGVLTILLVSATLLPAQSARRNVITRVPAQYPEVAMRMRISGTVVVATVVEPGGAVAEAHATTGHALLKQAAEQAVLRWKFAAAPTSTNVFVEVVFQPQ